ncbi:MAG: murein hydrolase activator EnvC family protein [Bacteroidota bacterium]|jgi:septal ring factor EnvC (AmiA/AmiB activator)|nr:peptidoglycan DD-metalloendopeptidase family protein [Cytophagales bacterium]MCE2956696.1 peptidoglycan DD-metalloendopeptidase family protein [Flammeovirgaceae bacterium]MCZ8069328.1 peptidoglycan DD-metalloendopeptidase family protein [Cytophagales bacterium]
MTGGKHCFLFIGAIVLSISCWSQKSKSQLQREKQQNLEKIKETEKILTETTTEKKNSIGELRALNKRIEQQEVLMTGISAEIELLDLDIQENNQIINSLELDVDKLKEEYAAMVFSAQKASGKIDKLTFLFSASSFDQLIMRLKYMEQYGKARQEQAEAIARVQSVLTAQVKQTEIIKSEKQTLLDEEKKESDQLTGLKKKKNTLVKSLEKEEKRLKRELAETKKAIAELENMIAKLIKEEMERAAVEAKRLRELKAKVNKKAEEVKEEEDANANIALSASFEENKNKFPWPTSGFVSQRFGKQMHPVLKGIEIQNNGINIQTKQGEAVRAIFNGQVIAISFYPGIGTAVLIKHGEYFTVYLGLKDVMVKTKQKIETNAVLGKVIASSEGISELRFQIFRNSTPVDPQQWLRN